MYIKKTPEETARTEIETLITDTMGKDYVSLSVRRFSLKEDYSKNIVTSTVELKMSNARPLLKINGSGVGIVDSVFMGYFNHFRTKYCSLDKISLESFNVRVEPTEVEKTRSAVSIVVEFGNSYGKIIPFRASTPCLTRSAVTCLNAAYEYYINCELSFRKLKYLTEESQSRGRFDIKESYTSKLVKLVGVSSYEEVC